jgi:hypothetical protein
MRSFKNKTDITAANSGEVATITSVLATAVVYTESWKKTLLMENMTAIRHPSQPTAKNFEKTCSR